MKIHPKESVYLWNNLTYITHGIAGDNEVATLTRFGTAMIALGARGILLSNQDKIEAARALREFASAIDASAV